MDAAVVWKQRAQTPPSWGPITPNTARPGRAFRSPYHPRRVLGRWTGQRFHLGKNKEASPTQNPPRSAGP